MHIFFFGNKMTDFYEIWKNNKLLNNASGELPWSCNLCLLEGYLKGPEHHIKLIYMNTFTQSNPYIS